MKVCLKGDATVVAVVADEPTLAALLVELPAWWVPTEQPAALEVAVAETWIEIDGERIDLPPDDGARAAASRIELAVAERLPDRAAVHAGAVSVDGRAVVLPGPSRRGKSSLVRALLARGAAYLSDEYTVIGTDGRVSAYPRSLTLRTSTGSQRMTPSELDAYIDTSRPAVSIIAELAHDIDAGWAVRALTAGEATFALLRNSVGVRRNPALTLECLTAAAATSEGFAGTRGEAEDAADWLLDRLVTG